MSLRSRQALPLARREEVVAVEVDDELLLYDLASHRAHRLNGIAALVWRHCDGATDVASLAALLSLAPGEEIGEDVVRYALARLSRAGLLRDVAAAPAPGLTRRSLLRGLARAGLAAGVLPVVASIVAPTTLEAQMSCLPAGSPCDPPNTAPCCPGLRCRGLPPGQPGTCQ